MDVPRRVLFTHYKGIDPQTAYSHSAATPYNAASFAQIRVTEAWQKYDSVLSWGDNQCLAILDDGENHCFL